MPADPRETLLRGLLSLGVVAAETERELLVTQRERELTRAEERRLGRCGRAVTFVHRISAEFVRNGVVCRDQDLSQVAWWPDASRCSELLLDIMRFISKAELQIWKVDSKRMDLRRIDLRELNLRRFVPPMN